MLRLKPLSFLLFVVFSSSVFAEESKILFPGNVILGKPLEVGQKLDLGDYLALHKIAANFVITKTKVYFTSLDGEVAETTSSINGDSVIAYIKDKNIKDGAVSTASSVDSEDPDGKAVLIKSSGVPVKIRLGKDTYLIGASRGGLSLTGPEGASVTSLPNWSMSKFFTISWAGDLDRDGRPDFIIFDADADEKGVMQCLLLSSAAIRPELLRAVACQHDGG